MRQVSVSKVLTWPTKVISFPSTNSRSQQGFVPGTTSQPVSELLAQWRAGGEESLRRLVPLVYNELRRLAHYYLRRERPGHTLQTTALVHEAYLCLMREPPSELGNRAFFFAVCCQLDAGNPGPVRAPSESREVGWGLQADA
jgi:hypothetical protein